MEKLFWQRLQRYLKANKKGFWARIESPVSPGFPDVFWAHNEQTVLLELKWSEIKRKKSVALTYKLSREQIVWLTKCVAEKIPSYVLLGSCFGAILLPASSAVELNEMSYEEAESVASWRAVRSFSGLYESLFKKGNNEAVPMARGLSCKTDKQ